MVDKDAGWRGYDEMAETYAAERSTEGPGLDILTQFHDSLGESARVLDAGCGQGWPVDRELRSVGVDLSREQLRGAGENASTASLVQGDMVRLPIRVESVMR